MIFKRVGAGRPYPEHGLDANKDSTFFGDLFAHVVRWRGDDYLEDGLHRALCAALQQRLVLHARVMVIEE